VKSEIFYGGDEGTRTLIDRFTRPTPYPVKLHRRNGLWTRGFGLCELETKRPKSKTKNHFLVDWEGLKPSQKVCRTSMLSVTSPAPVIAD
jgi:hypothetical protein